VYQNPNKEETKYHTLLASSLLGCYILNIHLIHMTRYVLSVHIHPHTNKTSLVIRNWWRTNDSSL